MENAEETTTGRSLTSVDGPLVALAVLLPLCVYLASLPQSVSAWDIAEMQTAPYVLGIPHPTGFPFFILSGWLFSHLFAFGNVAWRMNVFSALTTAGTSGLLYLTSRGLGATRTGALFGALLYAAGDYVWKKAMGPDVHVLTVFCTAAALFFLARYLRSDEPRELWCAAAAVGFGLATHPNALWTIPALAFAFLTSRKRSLGIALAASGALLAPLLLYLYMPIRSSFVAAAGLDLHAGLPNIPGGTGSSLIWDTNATRTFPGFVREILGSGSGAGGTLTSILHLEKYPEYASYWWSNALPEIGLLAMVLAVLGLVALWQSNRRATVLLLLAAFCPVPFAFSYGYNESDSERYLLASFAVTAVFASFAPQLRVRFVRHAPLSLLLAAALLFTTGQLAYANRGEFVSSAQENYDSVIEQIRTETPPDAIIFCSWSVATTLAYGEDIEGVLGRRIILQIGPDSAVAEIPAWRRLHRIFVYSDWILGPEVPRLPAQWVTETPTALGQTKIYELCADPSACPL